MIGLALIGCGWGAWAADFKLTILHNNDVHAHMQPEKVKTGTYGGYARIATLVQKYRASDPNVLLLSAGDVFQGTLYFNAFEGLADVACMNLLGYDAMAVGNHELDKGPAVLESFAKSARFPLLAANLDASADRFLKDRIKPSTVLTIGGEKIAVVGAITPDLPNISSPGPDVRMKDLKASIQAEVDRLTAEGINKIVLLTHVGLTTDRELARTLKNVDVIVGGHSHTPIGAFESADLPKPQEPYPVVVKNADGGNTLVVTAWRWGLVLGRLQVTFDDAGKVSGWSKDQPVPVGANVAEDPIVASLMAAFTRPIAAANNEIVGQTNSGISTREPGSSSSENLMANVIADAQLEAAKRYGAVLAMINEGGVRSAIDQGPITYGEAISAQPFGNTIIVLDLSGEELSAALDMGVGGGTLHLSKGSSYTVDSRRPKGKRVTGVTINGQPLDPKRTYRVAVNNFTAGGGDSHEVLKNAKGYRFNTEIVDVDALVAYFKARRPLDVKPEGRIKRG